MKQLKTIVALVAGLFAFTSVNAGEMSVTGTMQATYQSEVNDTTGNPLGMNTDLTFTGETEVLDGTAVKWTMGTDGTFLGDSGADHKITFASPYGTFKVGNSGDSANAVDDITPSAFEEANGSGSGTYSTDFGSGLEGSMSVGYALADILGSGISVDYTYYPKLDATLNNEKGASATGNNAKQSAESYSVKSDLSKLPIIGDTALGGLKVTAAYEHSAAMTNTMQSKEGATVALNYAQGPLSLGVQNKYYQPETTAIATKTIYRDHAYGVAYAVNDALAVSYNIYESTLSNDSNHARVQQETKAINLAYTVGGLTLAFQDAKTSGNNYVLNADDDTRTISVKTAF
jgi:hypothetical protein